MSGIQNAFGFMRGVSRATLSQTYSSNASNVSLDVSTLSGYISGKSDITITVNSGIYIWSSSNGTPALTITGTNTGDTVKLINNGYIMGGAAQSLSSGQPVPGVGGAAISISSSITIDNTNSSAYIGGAGGSGAAINGGTQPYQFGGGAGGGYGGANNHDPTTYSLGGSVGNNGSAGTSYTLSGFCCCIGSYLAVENGGGGGGRVFPGTNGPFPGGAGFGAASNHGAAGGAAGGGGGNINYITGPSAFGTGGDGGSVNANGGNASVSGTSSNFASGGGGGGGWGASGGSTLFQGSGPYAGFAGGKAVALNGNSVTWVSGNTTRVYGAVA
jgi:hypothetical protein